MAQRSRRKAWMNNEFGNGDGLGPSRCKTWMENEFGNGDGIGSSRCKTWMENEFGNVGFGTSRCKACVENEFGNGGFGTSICKAWIENEFGNGDAIGAHRCGGSSRLVRASMWRLRTARQREARDRDKRVITWLEEQLATMYSELLAWQHWWQQQQQQAPEHPLQLQRRQQPLVTQQPKSTCIDYSNQQPKSTPIDYSKWDHLDTSDEEGHEDAEVEQEEEEPDGNEEEEENWHAEQEDEDYGYGFKGEGYSEYEAYSEEGEEEERKDKEENEKEDGSLGDGDAEQAETKEEDVVVQFTDCCASNKQLLQTLFSTAYDDAQAAFAEAELQLTMEPEHRQKFKALEETSLQQLASYSSMLSQIQDQQFHCAGAGQLHQMLHQNMCQMLHNIAELERTICGRRSAEDDAG